ncbi:hypothetical protein [Azospirillum brasilense]|uniref:hypothetical protein n=1 Tax=Azospirillum brasilense TaxID=192 RepID=UPI0015860774|nr:hypothetical protein [Azospirillum brasilense]
MTTDSRLIPKVPIPARSKDRNAKTAKVFVLTLMSFMVFFSFLLFWWLASSRVTKEGFLFLFVFVDNYELRNEPVAAKLFIV